MATHVVFEPLDFMARLAALVPNPRINLTRYHGVFAPNHHWRALLDAHAARSASSGARGEAANKSPRVRDARPVEPRHNAARAPFNGRIARAAIHLGK